MPDIVLATLNARFIHAAFGLRYLRANLGEWRERACIAEFDINQRPIDVAGRILELHPRVVGLGVYIWNVTPSTELVSILKKIRPGLKVILGGPEVSYETEDQPIARLADHVITGEADLKFAEVCRSLLDGGTGHALPRVIDAGVPDLAQVQLPYDEYDDRDVAHRIIYVEASRGCPYTCEFCLSSLEIPVRQFAPDRFLASMERLIGKGVRHFKFVDRTFNLQPSASRAILEFFRDRWRPGMFLHFEMIPDRLPDGLKALLTGFPPGALQFEVGIQTLDTEVGARIRRRQDLAKAEEHVRWLRRETGVHVHADLIAGLPGEGWKGFAAGFDRLWSWGPQEIQVGLLKRLRGTPITRHDDAWGMVYSEHPPYEILQTSALGFDELRRLRRFARHWDLFANSGRFPSSLPLILGGVGSSAFESFDRFSAWLETAGAKPEGIALSRQFEWIHEYGAGVLGLGRERVVTAMAADYRRAGRSDRPPWMEGVFEPVRPAKAPAGAGGLPARQARHVGTGTPGG